MIAPWLLALVAAATLFVVMLDLGMVMVPGEFRWVLRRPALMARALFAVLIAAPAIVWAIAETFELPRSAQIGMMLIAIAPGAPVALRNSMSAGGHRAFAPALQIAIAMSAIVSMPAWIAGLEQYYGGAAAVDPRHLARQVVAAQLLPLALGMVVRVGLPATSLRLEPLLHRTGSWLLVGLLVLVLVDLYQTVIDAGLRVAAAIVAATALALLAGHWLGGPEAATRTATAIASASRNAGLALLVATLNRAAPEIVATVLAYWVISGMTVIAYARWRRHRAIAMTT
ncbi:MAG: bile acid:sodium symporter [Burkholderiales bacterium]|nr:bile acid:sodium symporter [Burkholderiales bacterium]